MGKKHPLFLMQPLILEKVKTILEPMTARLGAEIVDITYKRGPGGMVLGILVDKPGGITLDECTELNNRLSSALDMETIIDEYYIIEVSSPGLDRPLKTKEDFKRVLGKDLDISTYAPVDKKSYFKGSLIGLGENGIVLEDENGISYEIPFDKIANAKIHIEF